MLRFGYKTGRWQGIPRSSSVCFVSSKMSYGHPYQYNPDQPYGSTPTTPASFAPWDLQEQDTSFQPPPQQDANPLQQPQTLNSGIPIVPVPQRVSASSQGLFRLRDYVHQPSVEPSSMGEDSVDRLQGASGVSPSLPGPHRSAPVRETRAAHPYRRSSGSEGVAQRLRRGVHEPSSSSSHLRVSIPAIIGPTAITLPCPGQQHTASVGVPPASGSRYAPPFLRDLSVVGTDLAPFFSSLPLSLVLSLNSSMELPSAPLSLQPAVVERNYAIRADVFYDKDANLMKAMLELPGLKKSDLRITLSRCPYTCVKQLTVSGKSKPVFPDVGLAVKERRFGKFYRTMAVPSDTTVRFPRPSAPCAISLTGRIGREGHHGYARRCPHHYRPRPIGSRSRSRTPRANFDPVKMYISIPSRLRSLVISLSLSLFICDSHLFSDSSCPRYDPN